MKALFYFSFFLVHNMPVSISNHTTIDYVV